MTPVPPRRRTMNAEQILARLLTDVEGQPVVDVRWVRENFPYKVTLSQSRVFWYEDDVEEVIAKARATGTPIPNVKLERISDVA